MPIYYATGSKCKALWWCFLSGITEPIGGIIGFAIFQPVMTPLVFGIIFGMVGGMMVFIVCHELLPAAHRQDARAEAGGWRDRESEEQQRHAEPAPSPPVDVGRHR